MDNKVTVEMLANAIAAEAKRLGPMADFEAGCRVIAQAILPLIEADRQATYEEGLADGLAPRPIVTREDRATDGSTVWLAEAVTLPGCMAHGETDADARNHLREAIHLYLSRRRDIRPDAPPTGGQHDGQ